MGWYVIVGSIPIGIVGFVGKDIISGPLRSLWWVGAALVLWSGVMVLGERLRRAQWVAVAIGTVAVLVIAIDYGRPPWIALVLAFSFGMYGFCKKRADVGAADSLAIETSVPTTVGPTPMPEPATSLSS
jgi:drug/metabolite transporter (DMT)-like permease